MTIIAKVIADSIGAESPRITSLQLRYPRFIHAELMTHRVFSRSASSSRAIPVERMIRDVIDDPAMPVSWGSNKPGMQAGEEIDEYVENWNRFSDLRPTMISAKDGWLAARDAAVAAARAFAEAGYHKQIPNRLLEPFAHISVIVTATEWDNFFALRCHPAADPTMRALSEAMRDAMDASGPEEMDVGWWHLPYITESDWDWSLDYNEPAETLAKVSAARCARVSYMNHDNSAPDITKDIELANRLLAEKHMSPSEHQARIGGHRLLSGNFAEGWEQHRKMIEFNL